MSVETEDAVGQESVAVYNKVVGPSWQNIENYEGYVFKPS